jgi:putative oxidoreductase
MFDRLCRDTLIPLLLRLGLAVIFIYHGVHLVGDEGHQWGTNWKPDLPVPVQALAAWGQLVGGIALVLGFLTRLAAVGIAAIMAGAIATVHWPHGFSLISPTGPGYEYNFLIIVVCAALVLGGGGTLAVDRVFRLRRRTS